MGPKNFRNLLFFAGAVWTVSWPPAFAQDAFPVFIEFDFGEVESLKNSPTADKTKRAVAESEGPKPEAA